MKKIRETFQFSFSHCRKAFTMAVVYFPSLLPSTSVLKMGDLRVFFYFPI